MGVSADTSSQIRGANKRSELKTFKMPNYDIYEGLLIDQ